MSKKIKVNQLTKEIQSILNDYVEDVSAETKEVVDEVTQGGYKIVKKLAPVNKRKKNSGKYKKSIKKITLYESLTEKRNVIYASGGEHRLTHLLERGHALVKGGRTKAQPHFAPAEDYVIKEFPNQLKKKIGGR